MTPALPFLKDYFEELHRVTQFVPGIAAQIDATRAIWLSAHDAGGKVIFIGNGGSAAIASHLAVDLSKNGRVRATSFNDASKITCLANDYGFEAWIANALRLEADCNDVLVAISSSGRSANILNGVAAAHSLGMKTITLSGMAAENPLRQLGLVNFWAESNSYNLIETAHQFWMMCVIDLIIGRKAYSANEL